MAVLVWDINDSALEFQLPKSYQELKISSGINGTITEVNRSSCDSLTINSISASSLNFTFAWPDAAVQYNDTFYFAGQEKFEVGLSNITVRFPKKTSVFWVEGSNLTGTYEMLSFERKRGELLPSFSYSFLDQPKVNMSLETSSHVDLHYYPIMVGKSWINRTLDFIEQNWNWLRTTLNGSINSVNVTFAPYGYNDLGTKKSGLCYYNSRNIEIVATQQYGIGLDGFITAVVLHELTHAFTPLFEDLPSFYSEAIAEDFSYEALRRMSLNETADSLEESRFADAYWNGVQRNLMNYTWMWKWNDIIYDNYTITSACYGVSAFIGDYILHHWGYTPLDRVNSLSNKIEINSLNETQRFSKFVEYLSTAYDENMSEILSNVAILINQWNDANHMREESYTVAVSGPSTLYISQNLETLVKEANDHYNNRNYDLSIGKFEEARNLVNSELWQWLDYTFWISVALVVVCVIVLVRRRR
ncbi:hypothetical protein MUP01_05430 [Candidatus Bathyarchaeota archaeon]|nr:hypothetical protein [Candidatus Bathyarchaeota archaeon]